MSGKYMKVKRIVVPTLTLILIASQLFGVTACGKDDMRRMSQESSQIEIEYAVPDYDTAEDSKVELLPWLQLASLETHPELRDSLDKLLNITGETGNKEGILYYNPATQEADQNATYYMATQNPEIAGYLMNDESMLKFGELAPATYTDVEADDSSAPYAVLNAYFDLLPDQSDAQFDGESTISRAQAMTLVMRATTPVNDKQAPETDTDFTEKVGESTYTDFAAPMNEYAYINTKSGLNEKSFNSTMTKGEYICLVTNFLRADYKNSLEKFSFEDRYSDTSDVSITTVSDAGDISFQDAIADATKGVPTEMYNTFKVAIKNQYIDEKSLSDWDDALTKKDALTIFTTMATNYFNATGNAFVSSYISPSDSNDSNSSVANSIQEDNEIMDSKWADINGAWDAIHQWTLYAREHGADGTMGWCWEYRHGKGAGSKESYAVYMKEDSPYYKKVYHVGDTLPDGEVYRGSTAEEHSKVLADEAIKSLEEQGCKIEQGDGEVIINLD